MNFGLNLEKMCKKVIELADDIDMILGGMGWLVKDEGAKKLILEFDPKLIEQIDLVKKSSNKPLKSAESLILSIDKYLIKSQCKKNRTRKKEKGIKMMTDLLTNVTNEEAYIQVCSLTDKITNLLSKLLSISEKILKMRPLRMMIVSNGGPDILDNLDDIQKKSKKALVITKRIHKVICITLKSTATVK
jgi:hypothetical protein